MTRKNVEKALSKVVEQFPAVTEEDKRKWAECDAEKLQLLKEHSLMNYERKLTDDLQYAYFAGRIRGALDMAGALHVVKTRQMSALTKALSIPEEAARQFVEEYDALVWWPDRKIQKGMTARKLNYRFNDSRAGSGYNGKTEHRHEADRQENPRPDGKKEPVREGYPP